MSATNQLLEAVESAASRGQLVAVVRVLRERAEKSATIVVRGDKLVPAITDFKLTAAIKSSVETATTKGSAAELVDAVDEQGSHVRLAVEIVRPKIELVVFGAGHVGQAVALMGAMLGYEVTVVDDREEFASRKRLPSSAIRLLVSDFNDAINRLKPSRSTAVVIVTRGHQYDELCLKQVVTTDAAYIGMIGSRRRVLSVFKKLVEEGFRESDLQRVRAPIGLRIGAKTPQEIAISILAEIIDHINKPDRKHGRERNAI
jgi:xanthine dehydrogenase accessory factor